MSTTNDILNKKDEPTKKLKTKSDEFQSTDKPMIKKHDTVRDSEHIDNTIKSEDNKMKKIDSTKLCKMCKRKLGLCDVQCRCGIIFCPRHRHPHQHNCTHDFKEEGKKQIIQNLPQVIASKMTRIEDV